jgi:hypothetical protein
MFKYNGTCSEKSSIDNIYIKKNQSLDRTQTKKN